MHSVPEVRSSAGVRHKSVGYKHSNGAFTDLLDWMKRILPRDKVRVALNLIRHPLDSVSLSGEMYQQFERAFDGIDRVEDYVFSGDETKADWLKYKDENLGGEDGWRSYGMETLRSNHNGIAIVDLARDENNPDARPEPYFYVLDVARAYSFSFANDDCQLEYLAYYDDKKEESEYKRLYIFDDTYYRVLLVKSDNQYSVEVENAHGLGYCPAYMFWKDTADHAHVVARQHPFTDYLGALDWYQLNSWFDRYGDLFNGWPITTTFQHKCNYVSETEYCDDGYLRATLSESGVDGIYLLSGDDLAVCPACKDRNAIGPGTNYEVPMPNAANGNMVMLPAVGITQVDVAGLKHQSEKLEHSASKIFAGVVGSVFEAINNQAVNEKQVASLFESRKNVIVKLARNFEAVQSWVESTICRLRYGGDFKSLSINYGTKFFMFSESEIMETYIAARDGGVNNGLLDELQNLYFQTRHRRHPKQLERIQIITSLDPARHVSNDQLLQLRSAGMLSDQDFAIKLNLSTLLGQFERDHGPVTEYLTKSTMRVRIDAIKSKILTYLPEQQEVQAINQNQNNGTNEGDIT